MLKALSIALLLAAGLPLQPAPQTRATSHVGAGYRLMHQDRFEEAANEFATALAADPDDERIRYQRAVCLFASGKREESRAEFERLPSMAAADPQVVYYLGRIALLSGDNDRAIRLLRSIAARPPFPDTAFFLAGAYFAKGDNQKAAQWFETAVRREPNNAPVHYRLGRAYQALGDGEKAAKEFATSTNLRQRLDLASRDAVLCGEALKRDLSAESHAICNRLFDPNDPDKLMFLGMLYGDHKDYEASVRPLELAAKLDPESFEAYHNLGLTYFRLRRYPAARTALERALSLRPDYSASRAVLAAVLLALGEDEAGYAAASRAHQLDPENKETVEVLFQFSVALAKKAYDSGDYPACLKFLQRALDLHPGDAAIQSQMDAVREKRGLTPASSASPAVGDPHRD